MSDAGPPLLEASGVSVRYDRGRAEALVSASFSVAAGDLLAVLGPNGAGKSTLLRLLAGSLTPDAGHLSLRGASLADLGRREVAREVAFVTQSEEVRFPFSVREVVMMGRAPHQRESLRPSPQDAGVVEDALRRFDLEALADRGLDELSGGEKKRVAIARAFAQAPRILLLDEPTAFLDVRHQVALFEELRRHVACPGHACVVVTHDLQLAAAHATRVLLLKAGRLVAAGGVADVLDADLLGQAFDCPIDVGLLEGTRSRVFVPRASSASVSRRDVVPHTKATVR